MVVLTLGLAIVGDEVDDGNHRRWVMTGSAIYKMCCFMHVYVLVKIIL
jgi:hypothetical protein